ncbi:MAG: hypothetical protein NTU91_12650, partial [Chloroflexi bacterium]|nr:hypothetical protein [Chloroflexota bacterium]
MTDGGARSSIKRAMGGLPLVAEAYQAMAAEGKPPAAGFALDRLQAALPAWQRNVESAGTHVQTSPSRRLLVFGALSWWIEYAAALSLVLSAAGHRVDLAYVAHRRWMQPTDDFDLRRQRAYLARLLRSLAPRIRLHDLSRVHVADLPPALESSLQALDRIDVQYTRQRESLDLGVRGEDQSLLELRSRRNRHAAAGILNLLKGGAYDAVVIPNGSILEFGAAYRTARHLGVRGVTYEFGEQRERMWLAQDDEVMRQDTSGVWAARGAVPLTESEHRAITDLYRARRGGQLWANFGRQW